MPHRLDVQETYDQIASHFAKTREFPWPTVERFLKNQTGLIGLDIGVGNGRHADLLSKVVHCVIGLDISRPVLSEAAARAASKPYSIHLCQGEASNLPIQSRCVDVAVYVATLHHLPSQQLRITSLNELDRVLTDHGRGLVSAWSTTHEQFDRTSGFDTTIDWTLPDGQTIPRFYHIYDPTEFKTDIDSSALTAQEVFVHQGNCYAIVTRGSA